MKKSIIVEIIVIFSVCLFMYTGINNLIEYYISREQLLLVPLLAPIATEIAIILPLMEIVTAILTFLPRTRKSGLKATLVLMILFTSYIIYILSYNQSLPCTCGGAIEELTWPQHLIFNILMIFLNAAALLLSSKTTKPKTIATQSFNPAS
jgi:hypothetical protein